MSREETQETFRGCWKAGGPRRDKVEYAIAVSRGVIVEVYRIKEWLPAGTLVYKFRDPASLQLDHRWEFVGEIAEDIRDQYVGAYVGGTHNPVHYVNV